MEARIGWGTGEDLHKRLNISALALTEQVIQCNHCWITEFDREKLCLFKIMQNAIYEIYPHWKILFFCHVSYQDAYCKTFGYE